MSKIALTIKASDTTKPTVIRELRKVLPLSVGALSSALSRMEPVFVHPLNSRDDPDFNHRLLGFLKWLEGQSIEYDAYEVLNNDVFDSKRSAEYFMIDSVKLRTMIDARARSMEAQQRIARFEEGVED